MNLFSKSKSCPSLNIFHYEFGNLAVDIFSYKKKSCGYISPSFTLTRFSHSCHLEDNHPKFQFQFKKGSSKKFPMSNAPMSR